MVMRRAAIVFAVTAFAPAAFAQTSVTLPLGKGEVLVRLQASGKDMRLADSISMGCTVTATGEGRAEARKALKDKQSKVDAAFKAQGLKTDDIRVTPNWQGKMALISSAMAVAAASDEDADEDVSEQQEYSLTVASVEKIAPLTDALTDAGCARTSGPDFKLADPAAAKRRATDAALIEARKSADLYAERLNLKVLRITRLEEGGGPFSDMMGPEFQQMMAMTMAKLGSGGDGDPRQVTTSQSIVVEFLMGPK
jgi:uncharacterized protein